jgi:hypothetical protein
VINAMDTYILRHPSWTKKRKSQLMHNSVRALSVHMDTFKPVNHLVYNHSASLNNIRSENLLYNVMLKFMVKDKYYVPTPAPTAPTQSPTRTPTLRADDDLGF